MNAAAWKVCEFCEISLLEALSQSLSCYAASRRKADHVRPKTIVKSAVELFYIRTTENSTKAEDNALLIYELKVTVACVCNIVTLFEF